MLYRIFGMLLMGMIDDVIDLLSMDWFKGKSTGNQRFSH